MLGKFETISLHQKENGLYLSLTVFGQLFSLSFGSYQGENDYS